VSDPQIHDSWAKGNWIMNLTLFLSTEYHLTSGLNNSFFFFSRSLPFKQFDLTTIRSTGLYFEWVQVQVQLTMHPDRHFQSLLAL
jgi:hypothetical protein